MIVVDDFAGQRVAVLGLARSGIAAARALTAGGADVLAWDDKAAARNAVAGDIPLADLAAADWRDIAALVLSPGIPHSFPEPHPAVLRAREAGAELSRDIAKELRRYGRASVVPISITQPPAGGVYADAGWLVDATGPTPERVLDLAEAERLPGSHNWQNAAAAYAAARILGLAREMAVV